MTAMVGYRMRTILSEISPTPISIHSSNDVEINKNSEEKNNAELLSANYEILKELSWDTSTIFGPHSSR